MLYYNINWNINKQSEVIYLEKKIMRREVLTKRAKLGDNGNISLSKEIVNTLMDSRFYKDAKTIMIFISFGSEINTHEFIKIGINEGKNIAVPVTFKEERIMKPSIIKNFDELEPGYYNILTPKQEFIRYIDPSEIDLVIVPGAVFDREGYRVGYGGGYYDKFLSSKIRKDISKIAIAFDLQIVDKVPREEHDISVDYIITEKEIIKCK
jgi:5-formyltetrahydrofolate cyclo-ligase